VNKTVIVTGIPGSGKTTVCDFVEKLGKEAGLEVHVVNYGTAMVELLKKYERQMGRDAMRKTSADFQHQLQTDAAKAIAEKTKNWKGVRIVDTHMSINTLQGYLPGLPYHVLQILQPSMFVLVEAKAGEISSRRMKDTTRKRDESVEDAVKEELLFSRLLAGACAVLTGALIKIVINAEGKQEEAAREILKTLKETEL
jgi:adenylate kinase